MIFPPRRDILFVANSCWFALPLVFIAWFAWSQLASATNTGLRMLVYMCGIMSASIALHGYKVLRDVLHTSYELTDDELVIRYGEAVLRVPLSRIVAAVPTTARGFRLGWSARGVRIDYQCRPSMAESVIITPARPSEFLEALRTVCPKLQRDGPGLCRPVPQNLATTATRTTPVGPRDPGARRYAAQRDLSFSLRILYGPAAVIGLATLLHPTGAGRGGRDPVLGVFLFVATAIVAYQFWCYLRTWHHLHAGSLEIACGPDTLEIPYAAIREVYPVPQFDAQTERRLRWCWAWSPLRIVYQLPVAEAPASALIAPRHRAQFLDELHALAPHLGRCGETLFRVEGAPAVNPSARPSI